MYVCSVDIIKAQCSATWDSLSANILPLMRLDNFEKPIKLSIQAELVVQNTSKEFCKRGLVAF